MQALRTGGSTDRTPYALVHEIVRSLCRDIAAMPVTPDAEALELMARQKCEVPELIEHGYYADFVQLAVELVGFYGSERRSLSVGSGASLELECDGHFVEIDPHDILSDDDGDLIWLVQTGHARKKGEDRIDVRALVVGAMTSLSNAKAQVLHLADRRRTTVMPKRGAETHFRRMVGEVVEGLKSGAFPKMEEAGPRACANCPALMICDALPPSSVAIQI